MAQNIWGLRQIDEKKCQKCLSIMNNLPDEIGFAIKREKNDLFLVCNNKKWFEKEFNDMVDGFCAEIVSKDQFVCGGSNTFVSKPFGMGIFLEPRYKREFKSLMVNNTENLVVLHAGTIPNELLDKEIEFNVILIKDKSICYRSQTYNIDSYLWDLLDMGMYMDTICYKNKGLKAGTSYTLVNKSMTFTIPFEKGKFDYSSSDIKPLYDSLNLTNFDITRMIIRAYSSVEGLEEKNIELQENRANSIVNALQYYQKPNIQTEINSAENWVEFMNDVSKTQYAFLGQLSKQEIKDRLNDKKLLDNLESTLQKHRKATITIFLEKKNTIQTMTDDELVSSFKKSIDEQDLLLALSIQQQVFQRISNQKSPSSLSERLEIPQKKEFHNLLNNDLAFSYLYNNVDPYQSLQDFERLDTLVPKNGKIKYNICVLKFRTWLLGKGMIDKTAFLKEINDLKLYGIDLKLIKRMLVNYNIIMCEYYMLNHDFTNKDKCLNFIVSNYKNIPYNPLDIINVAQYLVAYNKYDLAIKTVSPYTKTVDCDENLLFYYINLTIVREEYTKKQEFRNVMLNAYNVNSKRFCKLFNSYESGGVTFQLPGSDYLKRSYCESCEK